jgi:uncharacterized membrane protein HdeD (DUF308 family)
VDTVTRSLGQYWWLFLLRGVLSIVLGVLALVWPGKTLGVLILLFGLFVLLNGIVDIFASIGAMGLHQSWGWRLAAGIFGILAGLAILRWPGVTALIMLFLVALWAIVTGIIVIVSAIADHEAMQHAWLVVLAGVISVLFGIAMFVWPTAGLLTITYLIGIFAIVYGIMYCAVAFRVRNVAVAATGPSAPPAVPPTAAPTA